MAYAINCGVAGTLGQFATVGLQNPQPEIPITVDCIVIVGPEHGKVHKFHSCKAHLMAASPILTTMFEALQEETPNDELPQIRLINIEPTTYYLLHRHVHGEKLSMPAKDMLLVILAASKLKMEGLMTSILNRMFSTPYTVWQILDLARMFRRDHLVHMVVQSLQQNLQKYLSTRDFLEIHEDILIYALQQPMMNIDNEMVLVKAVENWAVEEALRRGLMLNNVSIRRVLQPRILPMLRLLTVPAEDLAKISWLSLQEKKAIISCAQTKDFSQLPPVFSYVTVAREKAQKPTMFWNYCNTLLQPYETTPGIINPEVRKQWIIQSGFGDKVEKSLFMHQSFVRDIEKEEKTYLNTMLTAQKFTCIVSIPFASKILGINIAVQQKGEKYSDVINLSEKYLESFDIDIFVAEASSENNWILVQSIKFSGHVHYNDVINLFLETHVNTDTRVKFEISLNISGWYQRVIRRTRVPCPFSCHEIHFENKESAPADIFHGLLYQTNCSTGLSAL